MHAVVASDDRELHDVDSEQATRPVQHAARSRRGIEHRALPRIRSTRRRPESLASGREESAATALHDDDGAARNLSQRGCRAFRTRSEAYDAVSNCIENYCKAKRGHSSADILSSMNPGLARATSPRRAHANSLKFREAPEGERAIKQDERKGMATRADTVKLVTSA